MEDKNIIINGEKYNFFKFFNIDQQLSELKYFNPERLVFTEPVTRKLNNINFRRVYVGHVGPKPRTVSDKIKNVYDVNELLNYDTENGSEFEQKYNLSKIEDEYIHILVNYTWYKKNIDSSIAEKSILYGISDTLYQDEPAQQEFVFKQFTMFDATALYKQDRTMLEKIPSDKYTVLLAEKWIVTNLSEKYVKTLNKARSLVFATEEVFSFGATRNSLDSNESYQIPLCLYDREQPTDDEIKWAAKYEELAIYCRNHLRNNPDNFKKIKGMIANMKGLSWKGGEVGDADGPKLYPKIMFKQDKEKFITVFMDENDTIVEDPKNILDKRCRVRVALRFESIFIGAQVVALQVRVNDVAISKWIESYKPKPLILRKKPITSSPTVEGTSKSKRNSSDSDSDNDSSSDLNSSSDEEEEQKPVKRVIKTVKI